ncbi:hypothetical protein [Carboxylicivirga sp. RSCT41]|uniref:hypothetical protein n=1 Tax=Carboxylicivirga agarovorans TaxID=3417570 RepID=UPI003D34810C
MRKIAGYGWLLIAMGILITSCEKSSDHPVHEKEQLSLSQALDQAAYDIDQVVEVITQTNAYSLFVREAGNKSTNPGDKPPGLNIYLKDIQGVYEYSPEMDAKALLASHGDCQSFFQRTGDSDWFIIHMPFEMAQNPHDLFKHEPGDTYNNNLMVSTSEFFYETDKNLMWHDYHLVTRFDLEEEYAGELWVDERSNGLFNAYTSSRFGFTDEHFIHVETQLADTVKVGYSLEDAEGVALYSEMVAFSLSLINGNPNIQFQYEIQVGDVRIIKSLDEEDELVYVVYIDGELREDAIVEAIIYDGETPTSINCLFMNKNKDYQIMLDDEPPILLSQLMGDSQDILSSLFISMRDLYLSKYVINILAWQIYAEEACRNK